MGTSVSPWLEGAVDTLEAGTETSAPAPATHSPPPHSFASSSSPLAAYGQRSLLAWEPASAGADGGGEEEEWLTSR
jgi:hypothetical protein